MFWKNYRIEKKLSQLNKVLSQSFGNVRNDTDKVFQWLDYFQKKTEQQQQLITQLNQEISYIPKTKEELKLLLDRYYSFEPILKKIKEIDDKVESLKKNQNQQMEPYLKKIYDIDEKLHQLKNSMFDTDIIKNKFSEFEKRFNEISKTPIQSPGQEIEEINTRLAKLEQKKAAIKEKIIKKITKNSKDYITSIILSYIKKYGKISSLQLKEMVVEEQGLCSKSSFYRILEEIEKIEEIAKIMKGKEKHYMAKSIKLQ